MKTFQSIQWLTLATILLLPVMLTGQPGMGQRQEQYRQMEAKRIAFITQELSLTPEEAQVFWPVYNEYNQKRNQMMIRHREERKDVTDIDKLSESELMELADEDIRNMEDMVALRREYHEKFKQILPVKKVILLYNAERDFNRKLYREGRGRSDSPGRRRN